MRLEVWLGDVLIGWLSHEPASHRFALDYAPEWLADPRRFPLSPRLPLLAGSGVSAEAHSAEVRLFFDNLLPEGRALDEAAAAHGVARSNLVGLLLALGRETAGALRVGLPGALTLDDQPASRRALRRDELSARIRARPEWPFSVWDGRVRLSIAGYQDKLAAYVEGEDWFLVEGADLASTHIFKPEPTTAALAGLTSNEFFCMRLARAVNLAVAEVDLLHVPEPVLRIARFDRVIADGKVLRHHVIDGCQALGLPAAYKYERPYGNQADVRGIRDGASLRGVFALASLGPTPAALRLALLRWVLFQVLIGNTDAHAKNLSFFWGPEGLTLAPAYDLVCGSAYSGEALDQSYALAIGDAFAAEELTPYEWAVFAQSCGFPARLLQQELIGMAKRLLAVLPVTRAEVTEADAEPAMLAKIEASLRQECARQSEMAAGIVAAARMV